MNSANYTPCDAFSLASAYMKGEVEMVGFARGTHVKVSQSPSKHLVALHAYFDMTGLSQQ